MKCKQIVLLSAIILGLGVSSCKENLLQEITELNLNRALSPTELIAQVVNRTGVRLNWKKVDNAQSYTAEIFDNADFSGSAVKIVDGITTDQLPYTVSGLEGETTYSVRVKAIGEGIDESKWTSATFTTDAEQIFNEIDAETLTATSVTLTWPAGEVATELTLNPENIRHTVTSDEIAAGAVTITGLSSGVTYTAILKNGDKTRGVITFTTLLGEGVTKVSAGEDLGAAITAAEEGAILAIEPGIYIVNGDLAIGKTITLQGYKPSDKPIIQGAILRVKNNAGLTLKDLILDATGGTTDQTIIYDEDLDTPYGAFLMENCEVKNYVKGMYYVNKKARIPLVEFKNNLMHDIECNSGEFIDFRNGIADVLNFVDNTVYNSGNVRDFFRMDAPGSTNFPTVTSVLNFNNNTFYNVNNRSAGRFLYIRLASHQINFTKNIIAVSEGLFTNQSATTLSSMSGNNYYNAPGYYSSSASGAKTDIGSYTTLDPGFTNPSQGNFTISNEDLKLNGIGASRWR